MVRIFNCRRDSSALELSNPADSASAVSGPAPEGSTNRPPISRSASYPVVP